MEFQDLETGLCFKLTNLSQIPEDQRNLYGKCVFKKIEPCLATDTRIRKVNAIRCVQYTGPYAEVWINSEWEVMEVECINHCQC